MLNPESVDKENNIIKILLTDDKGDEGVIIKLEIMDARRLARKILKVTNWRKI